MPHKKSAEHKARIRLAKKEKKWFNIMFSLLSHFSKTFDEVFFDKYDILHVNYFTQMGVHFQNRMRRGVLQTGIEIPGNEAYKCNPTNHIEGFIVFKNTTPHLIYQFSLPFGIFEDPYSINRATVEFVLVSLNRRLALSKDIENEIHDFIINWFKSILFIELSRRKINKIKEELVSVVWNPKRVESWLSAGVDLESL